MVQAGELGQQRQTAIHESMHHASLEEYAVVWILSYLCERDLFRNWKNTCFSRASLQPLTHTHTYFYTIVDSKRLLPLRHHVTGAAVSGQMWISVVRSGANLIIASLLADATSTRCCGGRRGGTACVADRQVDVRSKLACNFFMNNRPNNKTSARTNTILFSTGSTKSASSCSSALKRFTCRLHPYVHSAPMMPQVVQF